MAIQNQLSEQRDFSEREPFAPLLLHFSLPVVLNFITTDDREPWESLFSCKNRTKHKENKLNESHLLCIYWKNSLHAIYTKTSVNFTTLNHHTVESVALSNPGHFPHHRDWFERFGTAITCTRRALRCERSWSKLKKAEALVRDHTSHLRSSRQEKKYIEVIQQKIS